MSRMASGMVLRIASMNARNMLSLDRSGCSTQNRAKCQVNPAGMMRWQSYSTPILVDGMITPMRPRAPIQGSCGLVSLTAWFIAVSAQFHRFHRLSLAAASHSYYDLEQTPTTRSAVRTLKARRAAMDPVVQIANTVVEGTFDENRNPRPNFKL